MGPGSLQDCVWPTSVLEGAQVCRIFSPFPSQQLGLYVKENQLRRPEVSFSMLQPCSLGTYRAFLPHTLVMAPINCHAGPEAERAQFLQFIIVRGKRTSPKEDEKQEDTAVRDSYKQSRWNTLVLSAMRKPPAIPVLWSPPHIVCTPTPSWSQRAERKPLTTSQSPASPWHSPLYATIFRHRIIAKPSGAASTSSLNPRAPPHKTSKLLPKSEANSYNQPFC